MAFPYIFESNFEPGSNAEWDSETDTDNALDFPSYKTLARQGLEPFSGAHCMRLRAGLGTNDATVTEGDIDIADTVTRYFRFNILFADDFRCTATDASVSLLELQGAANAITASFGFKITVSTDVINLGIGSANAAAVPATFSTQAVERGVWYTVELAVDIQTGGTGTLDMYVTRWGSTAATGAEAALATKTNIAVTHGVLGLQDHLATTIGTILIDNFVMDDARIYPQSARYPETPLLTKTAHAFVGPGKIDELTLLAGGAADNVCKVYDTDIASTTASLVAELSNSIAAETVSRITPIEVQHGAYCVLSGTNPRALVKIAHAPYSAGAVRSLGAKRT